MVAGVYITALNILQHSHCSAVTGKGIAFAARCVSHPLGIEGLCISPTSSISLSSRSLRSPDIGLLGQEDSKTTTLTFVSETAKHGLLL